MSAGKEDSVTAATTTTGSQAVETLEDRYSRFARLVVFYFVTGPYFHLLFQREDLNASKLIVDLAKLVHSKLVANSASLLLFLDFINVIGETYSVLNLTNSLHT